MCHPQENSQGWTEHNDCPNCTFKEPHTEIRERCILWELLTVRATDAGWSVEEMRERIRRVNVDAFWQDVGPIIDNLVDGDYDYTEAELKAMEVAP